MSTISHQSVIENYSVRLVPVNQENQTLLFQWRNQAEIRQQMVEQKIITLPEHNDWFSSLAENKYQQHFVIYYKDQAIGAINIRCKTTDELAQSQHAEIGLYIANEQYKGNIVAFAPSLAINDYAFEKLNIRQLSSKVKADNVAALKYNQQLGYVLSTEKSGFIEITLNQENYVQYSQKLKQFLNRGNRRVDSKT